MEFFNDIANAVAPWFIWVQMRTVLFKHFGGDTVNIVTAVVLEAVLAYEYEGFCHAVE